MQDPVRQMQRTSFCNTMSTGCSRKWSIFYLYNKVYQTPVNISAKVQCAMQTIWCETVELVVVVVPTLVEPCWISESRTQPHRGSKFRDYNLLYDQSNEIWCKVEASQQILQK